MTTPDRLPANAAAEPTVEPPIDATIDATVGLGPETEPASATSPLSLSVILCVHNGAATMRGQLDALIDQQWDEPWEVVVVDNASTDDTVAVAESYRSAPVPVRVVAAGE